MKKEIQTQGLMDDVTSCMPDIEPFFSLPEAIEFEKSRPLKKKAIIKSPKDVLPLISFIADKKQECFFCITLNGAHEVITNRIVTIGLINSAPIHPREVFSCAILDRAVAVIIAHNHPSGSPEPSKQDIVTTKQLVDAGEIIGIPILDHIIIAQEGYVSFKERYLIQ